MLRVLKLSHRMASTVTRRSYYDVLGVEADASNQTIRLAYHELAQKYHPALNTDSKDQARFQQINEAYAILSGEISRRAYDMLRKENGSTYLQGVVTKQVPPKSQYALQQKRKIQQYKSRNLIDDYGRFKGGVPKKKQGLRRGDALGLPGKYYNVQNYHQQLKPQFQNVDKEKAEQFKDFHQDEREYRTKKWPWFKLHVDYDYFSLRRWRPHGRVFRNIFFWVLIVPTFVRLWYNSSVREQQNQIRNRLHH